MGYKNIFQYFPSNDRFLRWRQYFEWQHQVMQQTHTLKVRKWKDFEDNPKTSHNLTIFNFKCKTVILENKIRRKKVLWRWKICFMIISFNKLRRFTRPRDSLVKFLRLPYGRQPFVLYEVFPRSLRSIYTLVGCWCLKIEKWTKSQCQMAGCPIPLLHFICLSTSTNSHKFVPFCGTWFSFRQMVFSRVPF